MARIIKRTWTSQGPAGRRVRHTAFGYSVMVDGQRERRVSSGWATKDDALRALVARQEEIAAGQITPPERRSLKGLADQYVAVKTSEGKKTVSEDRRILDTQLLPALGATTGARALTAAAIAQYAARRIGEVSAGTVRNELAVLKHMLRRGRRWGYIAVVPDIDMPKAPAGRARYLEADEIARLLGACAKSRNPHLASIVTLAINTGMRRGEILGLEWSRVDLATARIELRATKGGKRRGVPMNRAVYDALVALEPDAGKRQGFVFKGRRGKERWGQVRTAWEGAVERAGLADFRFHDLRHTAASYLVMRGANLADVKEILGHSDFKMTTRYAHLSPAHLRAAVDRLDGLTAAIAPEPAAAAKRAPGGSEMAHGMAQNGKIRNE